jgi:hypothetical protein
MYLSTCPFGSTFSAKTHFEPISFIFFPLGMGTISRVLVERRELGFAVNSLLSFSLLLTCNGLVVRERRKYVRSRRVVYLPYYRPIPLGYSSYSFRASTARSLVLVCSNRLGSYFDYVVFIGCRDTPAGSFLYRIIVVLVVLVQGFSLPIVFIV